MKTKLAIIFLFITSLFFLVQKANAVTPAHLYMVFDKTSYNVNEEIDVTINLDQFIDLNEVKIQIKLNKSILEPIKHNDKYFYFNNSSVFQNDVINDYVDNSYLRLRLIKNDSIDSGYYSNYKNNLCHFKLLAKVPINNIYDYFTVDDYPQSGVSIYLFNTKDEIINFDIGYNEKMKVQWPNEGYQVEVFGDVPSFKKDISIINREEDNFEYLVEKQIDTSIIGLKTIHVGIYDKLTADYIILSKPIEVIDCTAPKIEYPTEITINDIEIDQLELLNYMSVVDNYDNYLTNNFEYFDCDYQKIENKDKFLEYLKNFDEGYFMFSSRDSSNNMSKTEYIRINIIDTTAPNINNLERIVIKDIEVDDFNLEQYFKISDNYDDVPKLVIDFIDKKIESEELLKGQLKKGIIVELDYYALDKSMNATDVYHCIIEVIDTIPPNITVEDLIIEDKLYDSSILEQLVRVTDNFEYSCMIEKTFFINDVIVSGEEFDKLLRKGHKGEIIYQATDYYQNKSQAVTQLVQLIDTTAPTIEITGIENNKKYTKVEKINYIVTDNFDGFNYDVYLDDISFNVDQLSNLEVGNHNFKIIAKDINNNITEVSINFEIITDNIIGCQDDINCYIDNYLEIFIIVITLVVFVIIIIVVKLVFYRKSVKK